MLAWTQVSLAALVGGLLALERRAFLQAMLSRPLISSTLTGALLGDLSSGLFVGMVLELFHLGSASLGASLPENDTLAATGTAAAAAAMTSVNIGSTPAMCSLAILVFAPLGPAGRTLDRKLDRYAGRLARSAAQFAEEGDLRRAVRQNLWGMWPFFTAHGTVTALCFVAGGVLSHFMDRLPLELLRGLAWAYPAMASVGAAIAVRGSHARRAYLVAGVAAVVVIVVTTVLPLLREAT
jgi:mannose/fructose/N-acetylgalactosamine-specific phosphotransferase system component IIC